MKSKRVKKFLRELFLLQEEYADYPDEFPSNPATSSELDRRLTTRGKCSHSSTEVRVARGVIHWERNTEFHCKQFLCSGCGGDGLPDWVDEPTTLVCPVCSGRWNLEPFVRRQVHCSDCGKFCGFVAQDEIDD